MRTSLRQATSRQTQNLVDVDAAILAGGAGVEAGGDDGESDDDEPDDDELDDDGGDDDGLDDDGGDGELGADADGDAEHDRHKHSPEAKKTA